MVRVDPLVSPRQVRLESPRRVVKDVPARHVIDRHMSIYWRMLRPELVKGPAEMMNFRVRGFVVESLLRYFWGGGEGWTRPRSRGLE